MSVKIAGEQVNILTGTLSIEDRIEERTVVRFTVEDENASHDFHKGQPVTIDLDAVQRFAGIVDSARREVPDPQLVKSYWNVSCIGHHYSADKRLAVKAYEEETAGAIVKDLLSSYLVEEGILGTDIEEEYNTTEQWQEGTLHQTVAENDKLVLDETETEEEVTTDRTENTDADWDDYFAREYTEADNDDLVLVDGKLPVDGAVIHLDADALSGYSDGDSVSEWPDQSGNNNSPTAPEGSEPVYKTGVLNGRPVLRFDETNYLSLDAFTGGRLEQPTTHFVVWRIDDGSTEDFAYAYDSYGTSHRQGFIHSDGEIMLYAGDVGEVAYNKSKPFSHIVNTGVCNGANSEIWEDGTSQDTGNPGSDDMEGIAVAARSDGDPRLSGDIAEIIIYDSELSTEDREAVENYLIGKWFGTYYAPEGTRTSPPLSLDSIKDVASSEITWTSTEPTDTNITIECAVNEDSTTEPSDLDYAEATSGQAIPGISAEEDLTGKYLWVRQTLTTDDANSTPQLSSLYVEVVGTGTALAYYDDGYRAVPISLSAVGYVKNSNVTWTVNEPTNTSTKVLFAISENGDNVPADEEFVEATDNQPIPGIEEGEAYPDEYLWAKQELETLDNNVTPEFVDMNITINTDQIDDGPELEEVVFNYIPVSQALDKLAESSGLWWWIDEQRRLFFTERQKYTAPFTLTEDKCLWGTIKLENTNPKYRNQQIITGVRDITDVQVDIRKGDGENDTFVTSFPVARVPEVKVARDADYTGDRPTQEEWDAIAPSTVGIRGLEEDKDWYWSGGSHEINQDRDGTVLKRADFIRIEYRGEYPLVIKTRSPSQIEARKEVEEHGTGIVEHVRQEPASRTREGAFQLATELIQKYGTIGRTLRFTTLEEGLKPGQLLIVNLPSFGLTDIEMLVEAVTLRENQKLIKYQVQAVEGPERRSWTNFFKEIVTRGEDIIREGIGEDEMIIIPMEFEKTWTLEETPNILRQVYPDGTYTAGDAVTPMFNPEDRVRYLEWEMDDGTRERKLITDSSGLDEIDVNEVYTLTYLDPGEALGTVVEFSWIGGIRVKPQVGTGIIVDTQTETVTADPGAAPWEKSELEAWQCEHTSYIWD